MNEATARLPWHQGGRQTHFIYDADGKVVAEVGWPEAAALIVKAVNAHDALVAACELASEQEECVCEDRANVCTAASPPLSRQRRARPVALGGGSQRQYLLSRLAGPVVPG